MNQALLLVQLHNDCPEYLRNQLEIECPAGKFSPNLKKVANSKTFRNVAGRALAHPLTSDRVKNLLQSETQYRGRK